MAVLRFEHHIPRAIDRVEATVLSPGFAPALVRACPALSGVELRRIDDRGDEVERVTRFAARLDGPGGRLRWVSPVAWVERVLWARSRHAARFAVTPELPAPMNRLVRCEGTYSLTALADGATLRRVEVSLSVRAPLVARSVEARIAAMLRAMFEAEAALLSGATT